MAVLKYEGLKKYYASIPEAKRAAYKLVVTGRAVSIEIHSSAGLSGIVCMRDGRLTFLQGGNEDKAIRVKPKYYC